MKIAFVDVAGSEVDAFEIASAMAEQIVSDVELVRFTAPDLLKIPASCARVLNEGAESVIVFATARSSDSHAVGLVAEKIIDVEINAGKFVFTAIAYADEWRTPQQLHELAHNRIQAMLEMASGLRPSAPHADASAAMPAEEGAMGMFSAPAESTPTIAAPEHPEEGGSRPLF